ncbi:MAG: hypothetical protein VYA60_08075 [Pseudomonadota bacterium]|nr:hypothetical protein [Pseudomonadota bacterium]
MEKKVTAKSSISDILSEYAYLSPMSVGLVDSIINLMGGDEIFVLVHEKVLAGEADYKLHGMLNEREVCGFFLLNRDALIEYGEIMAKHIGAGYESLIETIKQEGAGNNYSLDQIARALHRPRNDIGTMLRVDVFVASYLTELVIMKACKEYANMLKSSGYQNFAKRCATVN